MTEEPNTMILKFPKTAIFQETSKSITVKIDDAQGFLEQIITAFTHPHMAVMDTRDGE